MKPYLFNPRSRPRALFFVLGAAIIIFSLIGIVLAVAPGDLDPSFGLNSSGIVYSDINAGSSDRAFGLAIQPADGYVVVVGDSNSDFVIARYDTGGSLDTAGFGTGGVQTTDINGGSVDQANAVAVQSDGKIVVVGTSNNFANNSIAVARYSSAGVLDASFGSGGVITTTLGGVNAVGNAVAIQSNGQIIVAGTVDGDFAVARLSATDGSLDTAGFNSPTGYIKTDVSGVGGADEAYGIVIQSTGEIVLGGFTDLGNHQDFALARYTSAGILDTTFGLVGTKNGTSHVDITGGTNINDLAYALDEQSDGSLVLAGVTQNGATNEDFALARFNADGELDNSFGGNGTGTTFTSNAGSDWANAMAVQLTDKIVVAGFSTDPTTNEDFRVVRYNSDGTINTTFGASGVALTDLGGVLSITNENANSQDQAFAVAIQSDNKIVVAGLTDVPLAAGDINFAVARYESQNNKPTLTDIPKTGDEEVDIAFTQADFTSHFSDADNDNLRTVKITALPANGTLKLSGVGVSLNQEIAAADLGNLTYTPDTNFFGADSIGWNGFDGLDYATTAASINITINNINDAPSFTFTASPDQTVSEDATAQTVPGLVASMSAGPNEDGVQTVDFLVSNDNNALFSVQPAIDGNGDLTYTPAAHRFGSTTVTVQAHDNGGTGGGGQNTSAAQTFTITLTGVNDPPSFDGGGNVAVNEDNGATTVANWATNISEGPFETQTISFNVTTDNLALFSIAPDVSELNGDLTFTPAPALFGTATVTVTLSDNGGGDDTSAPDVFTITVNSVNDAPSFTKGGDQTVTEDAAAQAVSNWATGMSVGPANEASQTFWFNVSTDNDPLFSALPAIDATGKLTYTPAPDANGSATVTVEMQDSGGVDFGGDDTSAPKTFVINVTAVNDPPSLTLGTAPVVNEDAGPQTFNNWATNISAGPADESTQNVSLVGMTNDNNALFSSPPSLNLNNGQLTFTAADDASGSATVTFSLEDNGSSAPPNDNRSELYSFVITVNAVNDPPTFALTANPDQNVLEDAGAQTVNGLVTSMDPGAADETGQIVTFAITTTNDALFAVLPAIDVNGTLTYTPADDANGSATVWVRAQDDGGVLYGGSDTSAPDSFVIDVTAVNDAPSFTNGGDVYVDEEFASSGTTVSGWATDISAGASDESGQALTFNVSTDNDAMFTVLPGIDSTTGDLTLTAVGGSGDTAIITVTLSDNGGVANGGSDESAAQTFTVTVTYVNDPPTFTVGPDQTVDEDSPAQTVSGWATNMYAGSPSETGQALTFHASNDNNALFTVQPAIDAATGDLTYTPAPDANGSATVTVTLQDDGGTANNGNDTSAPQTFVITVNPTNDRPTVSDFNISGKVNRDISFTAADFEGAFADIDGDSLAKVKITSLPANGALKLNGTAVTLNQEILAADLGQLTFTPDTNWNGDTSFTWNSSDGTVYASAGATVNITVEQFVLFLPVIVR